MKPFTLFARQGWGSVLIEAQLEWYGLPFDTEWVDDLFKSEAARNRLVTVNPLAQIPTLILPDERIMTESAAITLLLADITGRDDLVPGPDARERPEFLRWLVYIVANIYPTFTYADEPGRFVHDADAAKAFRLAVDDYGKRLWRIVEDAAVGPWFLGDRFSALDIYVCAMSRWRPRRPWFATHAPRLSKIIARADAEPRLAATWARNAPASQDM